MFLDSDSDSPIDPGTVESTVSLTVTLAWAAAALVAAYVVVTLLSVLVRRFASRRPLLRDLATRLRQPMRVLLMIVAVWVAFRLSAHEDEAWFDFLQHGLLIATIVAGAWLVGAMAFVVEDRTLARVSYSGDDRHARRVQTQISILRRVTVAIIVILAIAAVLLTFPAMRAAGASILASAGVLSVVAGIAAQSSLANTFAGMQIAFTDAIRVDDVVVLDGEFGRIEEITLTYVVVHAWDDRRLILPSTYFTTTPFENWTRRAADLLGTVEVDVDYNVPLPAMRAELERLLEASPLWDRRMGILQVTAATGGVVQARALVSAADAGTLWDLRCHVREGLVEWLQREAPYALPRRRYEGATALPEGTPAARDADAASALTGADEERKPLPVAVEPPSSAASAASAPAPRVGRRDGEPVVVPGRTGTSRPRRPSVLHRQRMRSGVPPVEPAQDATVVLGEVPAPQRGVDETTIMPPSQPAGLYSGSEEAEARRENFEGPGEDAIAEREALAERRMTGEIEIDDDGEPRATSRGTARDRVAPDSGDGGPTDGPGEGGARGDGGDGGDGGQ
ncbi:mechanosensitive ion channel family protein [Isoptericola sp. S6320L]|uniref:mechanosensitive ion channel family protein n=1 Tax=Isoptericola sp. S6320L TaxID=2926411 RepID=UPI001FF5B85B|nr:mechanosensitive ion channel domain-containing protein [Isoptericola sp. S6320L]MCK0118234.1 mechanosensitive ion channel family protein [Isoptericola sp. S6320L]